jgi:hypothetical protein
VTVVEVEERMEIGEDNNLPTAHLPDDESMTMIAMGQRPTTALCGAEMLGILATPPFNDCEECGRIARERNIPHADNQG